MVTSASAEKEPFPGIDANWRLYRSPNFELYSHESDKESRALLWDLEILRADFSRRSGLIKRAKLDVTIFWFSSSREFKAYKGEKHKKSRSLRGYYLANPDRAVIVLSPSNSRGEARRIIYHEYIHHLFAEADFDPAFWYSEGMAELLAGIQIEDGKLEVGHPHSGRIAALRRENLLSLETLFSTTGNTYTANTELHTGLVYAQSWALLHYWIFGNSEIDRENMMRFVDIAGKSYPPVSPSVVYEHFEDCFGKTYVDMLQELKRYVDRGKYTYFTFPLPEVPGKEIYEMNPVSKDEIRIRLAELSYRIDRSSTGRNYLAHSTQWNSADTRPAEVLGAVAVMDGDTKTAIQYWEEAVASGSKNQAVIRELANIYRDKWFSEFDYYLSLPEETTTQFRDLLYKAIDYNPDHSASYETLAWVEASALRPSNLNLNLVQSKFNSLKKRARTLVALSMVRARTGKREEALKILRAMRQLDTDQWALQAAEVISATLEDRPVQTVSTDDRAQEAHKVATGLIRSPVRIPSVPLPEDL